MTLDIIQIIFFFSFPLLTILLSKKFKIFKWLSPVILCYAVGLLFANVSFFEVNNSLASTISKIAIPLAIPLLLFSTDFIKWLKYAKSTVLSFLLCVISVTICTLIAFQFFSDTNNESWKIAGMLIGVYTGGTPNMSAIGLSLHVNEETFILLNAGDLFICGIYLIFLMTFAQSLLLKFLPSFKSKYKASEIQEMNLDKQKKNFGKIKDYLISSGISVLILLIGVGLSYLIKNNISVIIIILTVTTLGIASSFSNKIKKLNYSFELGEYLLLIFCVAIGSLADFRELINNSSTIFLFLAVVMISSVLLHYFLAWIFRIDADTVIITSTAAIFSPAMVAPISSVLKNREILISGLTTGLVGYAIGNYLGILIAYFLKP